ncbi:hypothetical protein SAMN04487905_106233 [Actinopolyspora xinjiangensis]|uniref:Uncharacterized protein n=1 Tax=Actinopolyspora xinjiangensis TaxID=405564 RepID=A0A1H0UES8_9ACTN|nr:hypothetical protein SAMN04487905_106233 [Actinopolyspora xinjiangensis]
MLLWAVPLTAVALLGAVAGGLFARHLYTAMEQAAEPLPETSTVPSPVPDPPGLESVMLSEAAQRHPDSESVRDLLQRHFDAINESDYPKWRRTVVRAKRINQPLGQWLQEYRTTEDGTIEVHRIVPGPGRTLRVVMSFISTQDRGHAPKSVPAECLRWRVVYRLAPEDGRLRLGQGLPDSSLPRRCEDG